MHHPLQWLMNTKWTIKQEIVWDRMIAANIRGWRFWQIDEKIYWLYKPKHNNKIGEELEARHAMLSSIWRFSPERNSEHPAPFPLVLPARIIHSILNERGGIVLDPYAGSGTTCVAAKLLGCRYIGIDISKEYCDMAKKRLSNSDSERGKINEELKKHSVSRTFSERKASGTHTGRYRKLSQRRLDMLEA